MSNGDANELRPDRPAFIGIHTRDEHTRVLYISGGCRQALGYTPESLINSQAKMFIADSYDNTDYVHMFDSHAGLDDGTEEGNSDDEANAYTWQVNLKNTDGAPVFHRSISFKCDNCIIFICIAFPEVPFKDNAELEALMLDGKMTQLNVTRDRHPALAAPRRKLPLYYARNKQVKAAFVLEHPSLVAANAEDARRHLNGPLVVFVTGSVARLIDADPSDLHRYAFMRLVAPEDVLHVSRYFERMTESCQVQFETFSLLSRPPVIDGDVYVADEENERVIVECLGATVTDGVTLLLRKIAVVPAPKRDSLGHYIRPAAPASDAQSGYGSLFDLLSSDPDTSEVPESWSPLN
ncbi:hypothetical protein IWQ57_003100 [Coemansia nantahalensis]|uniref:Uncharacterized protein n=2 Tax=Coemansia TaxID=4863 RepID=A0ACC1LAG4_9FUNG|nr:hypothetical protein IWQ57_003100 [Coemansia nantahalensis]KAJ2803678.1 hypothetical protein H4R21_001938 [Coemansia helicoidea]